MNKKDIALLFIGVASAAKILSKKSSKHVDNPLVDRLNREFRWDGVRHKGYEYGPFGVLVGKDGLPIKKKR